MYSIIFIKKDQNTVDNTRILRISRIIQKRQKIWIFAVCSTIQYYFSIKIQFKYYLKYRETQYEKIIVDEYDSIYGV